MNRNMGQLVQIWLSMPAFLGYTWESGSIKGHVLLEAMLGEQSVVPIDMCRTSQV